MNYFEIVKKSFILPWKHKFLIGLGILAAFVGGGSGGGANFNYSFPGGGTDFEKYFQTSGGKVGQVLGESTSNIFGFMANHAYWIALVVFLLLVIFIVLWILGIIANAGLIRCVVKLEKGKRSSFGDGMKEGKKFFWRSVGYFVLIFLAVLLLIAILGGIAIPMFIIAPVLGFIWLSAAILIIILALIYAGIIIKFWLRMIVIEDKRVLSTIKEAFVFVNKNFAKAFIVWLINLLISIVVGIFIFLLIAVLAVPFVALAVGLGFLGGLIAATIIGVLGGLVVIAAMLLLSGYYKAATSTYWTLAYLEMKK